LPSVVSRDLDEDPLQVSFAAAYLLSYAEAKRALDRAKDDKDLEGWKGSTMMRDVRRNTRLLALERRAGAEGSKEERAASRALAKQMAKEKADKRAQDRAARKAKTS
jgi:hypothetical protein